MDINDVSNRTKEILKEYANILGLPNGWEQNLSIVDFIAIRNAAINEISKNIYNSNQINYKRKENVTINTKDSFETKQDGILIEEKIDESFFSSDKQKTNPIVEKSLLLEQEIELEREIEKEKTKEEIEKELFAKFQD